MVQGPCPVQTHRRIFLASEMKRDPAFALAVSSLERCLGVRERVGSSLIVGRPGKPPGPGGFDATVREKESKGPVSDSVEVMRRSAAVGTVRDRSKTDFKGKFSCGASGACVARSAAVGTVRDRSETDFKGKFSCGAGVQVLPGAQPW